MQVQDIQIIEQKYGTDIDIYILTRRVNDGLWKKQPKDI